jgi:2-oxoisovalerate dehydrogenase E2 component (dihydrolipoyl transacylase)
MGRFVFKLPDVGEGTAEAEIVAWHVKVGDLVAEDAPLVDVMTEKATVEMTSPVAGKVVETRGAPGDMAAVGGPIAVFEVEGAGNAAALPGSDHPRASEPPERSASPTVHETAAPAYAAPSERAGPASDTDAAREPEPAVKAWAAASAGIGERRGAAVPSRPEGERPLASPAVRRRAEDLGVRLSYVAGTGPAGRITHEDLDAFLASGRQPAMAAAPTPYALREGVDSVKVIGLRRAIARQMQEAKRRIPHFAYIEEVDMTELERLRAHLNAVYKGRRKLTVLPFIMRALVKILPDYPQINARFDDEAGIVHRSRPVHFGIATQTPQGLMVPVVRHAEALDLWESAAAVTRAADVARSGKGSKDDLSGSTITITSLGPLGGIATTPVINHPEVAIIGPNKIVDRPVVQGGQVVVRKMMNLSSSFDHRVVDGYDAAEFIQRIKGLLENPAALFID